MVSPFGISGLGTILVRNYKVQKIKNKKKIENYFYCKKIAFEKLWVQPAPNGKLYQTVKYYRILQASLIKISNISLYLPRKLSMCYNKPFQSDGKFDITTAHHILDFEVKEFCLKQTGQVLK